MTLHFDVIVIGAGHAGCEAAHAAARMGAHTCLVTMDMNKIAQMSCNPAVGGIAKGQIVREVDALGGGMGIVTDASAIQLRMLNKSKGPAMWSPRAQADRGKFIWNWRTLLDHTDNLDIWQDQVEELLVEEEGGPSKSPLKGDFPPAEKITEGSYTEGNIPPLRGAWRVRGVRTIWGCELLAPVVIVTAGTFLNGLMHIGRKMVPGGRCAEPAALHLTESITRLGIRSARMKTGTPVRIDRRSVHFEDTTEQPGEDVTHLFSFAHDSEDADARLFPKNLAETYRPCNASNSAAFSEDYNAVNSENSHSAAHPPFKGGLEGPLLLPCYTFDTTPECHDILRSGLADSPLFNGQIQSIGPRYCPSIETKLVTFADKDHHPLFLEPEGTDTNEMYLNGFSSSLPMDIQLKALRAIPALRDVRIYRPGYAIEYDFFDPTQLHHSLESKLCRGLFFAGQVNGTTGYEEAAGQGIIAGINGALCAGALGSGSIDAGNAAEWKPFTLHRDEAYIGVLIDDLVMKGVDEPYRMFTSRAEYRILLRQDDCDARLTASSNEVGLASSERLRWYDEKREHIERIVAHCLETNIRPKQVNAFLESIGSTPLSGGSKLSELIARPGVSIAAIAEHLPRLKELLAAPANRREEIALTAETQLKYRGYIERERITAEKMHRLENIHIRGHFNYADIHALSTEARQKLENLNPETLAQASRIPGVSPADIDVLLVMMGR